MWQGCCMVKAMLGLICRSTSLLILKKGEISVTMVYLLPSFSFCMVSTSTLWGLSLTFLAHAGLIWCFHNPQNSDMNHMIFTLRMWSFFCMVLKKGTSSHPKDFWRGICVYLCAVSWIPDLMLWWSHVKVLMDTKKMGSPDMNTVFSNVVKLQCSCLDYSVCVHTEYMCCSCFCPPPPPPSQNNNKQQQKTETKKSKHTHTKIPITQL